MYLVVTFRLYTLDNSVYFHVLKLSACGADVRAICEGETNFLKRTISL